MRSVKNNDLFVRSIKNIDIFIGENVKSKQKICGEFQLF